MIHTRAVQFLLGFTLIGCGPDAFFVIGPPIDADSGEGGEAARMDADAASKEDSQTTEDAQPKPDAAPDSPSCDVGVQACVDVETFYCSRMKTCCNGMCPNSWQNNGGAECMARFNNASCAGKMICETACIADLQAATCTTIKGLNAPSALSSSCMALY